MSAGCEICERYVPRYNPDNPYFIREFQTGWAVLGDNQLYPGYTIFASKSCVPELHMLAAQIRTRFLEEMALVAEAVFRACSPRKLNYELLGNSVSHLHWHIFPRYTDDGNPTMPIWRNEAFFSPHRADSAAIDDLRERIRAALDTVN